MPHAINQPTIISRTAMGGVFALLLALHGAAFANDKGAQTYQVALGSYMAREPAGWDGRSALPTAIYFHGWQATAEAAMRNPSMHKAFDKAGVLLIAPDGLHKTWAHTGSPAHRYPDKRDEIAFVDQVLADAAARWPVDEHRLWVTGFSQGGSMVWDVACFRGHRFAAFAPISGGFWRPHPDECPGGPVNLRHMHGTSDTVVPMQGRPIGDTWMQGNVREGWRTWRDNGACGLEPDRVEPAGALSCEVWSSCKSGKELQLCLHDGGHKQPAGWVEDSVKWVESLVR